MWPALFITIQYTDNNIVYAGSNVKAPVYDELLILELDFVLVTSVTVSVCV